MAKIGKITTSKNVPDESVELLQRIPDDGSASALLSVAQTYLKQGDRKHLLAAIRLLSLAHERDRSDMRALELLSFAFEKMKLRENARKTHPVRVEIPKELPSSPSSPG